jgi:uncharacterized membrane protein YfcA
MTTTILTEAAFLAIVPAGILLYVILDRYAAPRVPVSLFNERTLLIAFVVGIPGGLPLAVLFLIYAGSLQQFDLASAIAYLFFFVAVAALSRTIFHRFRIFGGKTGRLRTGPFYALSFGCGIAVTIVLATADSSIPGTPPLYALGAFLLLSFVVATVEAWAGIRFARRDAPSYRWILIAGVETLMLFALAPLYLGVQYLQFVTLVGMLALGVYLLWREDRLVLRKLMQRTAGKESPESAYRRTDVD